MPIKPMPRNMSKTPTIRPPGVTGEISPYPTVVTVTTDHQSPSIKPRFCSKKTQRRTACHDEQENHEQNPVKALPAKMPRKTA